jgi:formylglycine-generating enzyme required for sulfatase activity
MQFLKMKNLLSFVILLAMTLTAASIFAEDSGSASKKCLDFGFKQNTKDFDGCVKQVLQSSGSLKPVTKTVSPQPTSQSQLDEKFWDGAMAAGNKEGFQAYLNNYPKGRYAELARANLVRLNNELNNQQRTPVVAAQSQSTQIQSSSQVLKDSQDYTEMVAIPGGSFLMGSAEYSDEQPVHRVSIKKFLIGKTKVTQGQWDSIMAYSSTGPSKFASDNLPLQRANLDDVQQFIEKLNQKTGKKYRLPSEAEWEYAARAGSNTRWSFGDDESKLGDYAWYYQNSGRKTHQVGQKLPNAFGLFDMHGNLWEWTQDCEHENYNGAPTDGSAWTTGCESNSRVRRGGSFSTGAGRTRSSERGLGWTFNGDSGFRLASDL